MTNWIVTGILAVVAFLLWSLNWGMVKPLVEGRPQAHETGRRLHVIEQQLLAISSVVMLLAILVLLATVAMLAISVVVTVRG